MSATGPAGHLRLPARRALVLWAAALGAVAGVAGVLSRAADRYLLGLRERFTLDTLWMTPLAEIVLLTGIGAGLALAARPLRRTGAVRAAAAVAAAVAAVSVLLYYHPRLHRAAALVLAAGLAWRAAGWAVASPRWHRLARRTLALVAAFTVAAAAGVVAWPGWHEGAALRGRRAPDPALPNVLLIVLDTVRAANTSLHAYGRPTTPRLVQWSARGMRFDRAIAPAPWTGPSHASMFTGRHPYELSVDWTVPLDSRAPTLAERLRDAGYATAGFVGNNVKATAEFGFARGFDRYDDRSQSADAIAGASGLVRALFQSPRVRRAVGYYEFLGRRHAPEITNRFLDWQANVAGRPYFAFLNYFDAHDPYLPPAATRGRFGSDAAPRDPWVVQDSWKQRGQWHPSRVAGEMAAYDESIAALDAEVGRLLDTLASRGGLEHTLVIVTSDHGEEFGEHGQLSHGRNLFIGTLHVPLVVVWPGRVPVGSVAAPVSLRDLPATVLDLAVPGGPALPGRSLRRAWQGAGGDLAPPLSMLRGSVSVVDGRYHYVAAGDGAESVYDWWDDPSEQHDLVAGPSVQRDLPRWRGLVPAAARGERTR